MAESERVRSVQAPVIPIIAEWIRAHPGTISLGQGVVNYGPPKSALEAIARFTADAENHKYKPVQGIPPLLDALTVKLKDENGIELNGANRLVVTAGGNMAFVNAILAIASPGDEVILLAPYYFNHEMAVTIAGCKAVIVETDDQFQPRISAISSALTSRTRAIVSISPNNPTGAVYSQESLSQLNELCRTHGLYHINDEAYEYFTWDGASHYSPASEPNAAAHTISLFSLSKSYGFASWRIGYMVIPEHLFDATRKIQDTILICPPVISQFAAIGALQAGSAYCREKLKEVVKVRQLVAEQLSQISKLATIAPASGAFYFFMKIQTQVDAMTLVERLIKEHGVAVMPGTTFGMNDGCYLRIAYAALQSQSVAEGVGRFVKGIKAIAGGS